MKKLLETSLSVLVLMAAILPMMLPTTVGAGENSPKKTLVVVPDFLDGFALPGFTSELEIGERTYQQFVLLDTELNVIGVYRFDGVSTREIGETAWYGQESFKIDGEGVIYGVSEGDVGAGNFGEGAIVGGTGRFSGVSGEYRYDESITTVTFIFEKAPK